MENKIFINDLRIENSVERDDRLDIEGFCCHFNTTNLNNEIVDAKSFDEFFQLRKEGKLSPALNYNHTDTIIGGIDDIETFKEGLYMTAHINKNVAICKDMIIPLILSNDISGLSTEGFIKNGWDGIVTNEDDSYYVKSFILTGVAVCAVPADWDARFSLSNYLNEYRQHKEEEKREIEKNTSKWYLIS